MKDALYQQAIAQFQALLEQARATQLPEPAAMSLATVSDTGRPSVRTVLLKQCDERGFVFYTNWHSRKGRHIEANPQVALCFFWQPLLKQVLVEGKAQAVTDTEADVYWASRPRPSQIGAWASLQSQTLDARDTLEQRRVEFEQRYANQPVPRPPHWSGYRVAPDLIEFWYSRPGRLHERERYVREQGEWRRMLVYP